MTADVPTPRTTPRAVRWPQRALVGAGIGALLGLLYLAIDFSVDGLAAGTSAGATFGALVGAFGVMAHRGFGGVVLLCAMAGAVAGVAWSLVRGVPFATPVVIGLVAGAAMAFVETWRAPS